MRTHPSLHPQDFTPIWTRRGNVRLQPLWNPEDAQALRSALRTTPHTLQAGLPEDPLRYQYWTATWNRDDAPLPALAELHRWIEQELRVLAEQISGMRLLSPPDGLVMSVLYGRGCYLDAHNDADGQRAVAYVLGLTDDRWPAEEGGHLEFFRQDRVVERRPPGWNSLDLFHVEHHRSFVHQVPMVTTHRERRVIAGWFHRA
ncbi:MAG: 2OG-Fe(II) oxygenase family protein [Myxococcota bacterium]